jgi:late competence protein required for DNA uptake (superfamily II DNA/RNA helicase)
MLVDDNKIPDDHLVEETVNERFRCAVCTEVMMKAVTLVPCGHTFCEGCVQKVMDRAEPRERKCPKGNEVRKRPLQNACYPRCHSPYAGH